MLLAVYDGRVDGCTLCLAPQHGRGNIRLTGTASNELVHHYHVMLVAHAAAQEGFVRGSWSQRSRLTTISSIPQSRGFRISVKNIVDVCSVKFSRFSK